MDNSLLSGTPLEMSAMYIAIEYLQLSPTPFSHGKFSDSLSLSSLYKELWHSDQGLKINTMYK